MSDRRYRINMWYRTNEGRDYTPGSVTMSDRDAVMRLYRTMRDDPRRFGVPDDALLYVVGPVTAEQRTGSSWRYAGTPAAETVVIDRYAEWRDDQPELEDEPRQPALTGDSDAPLPD